MSGHACHDLVFAQETDDTSVMTALGALVVEAVPLHLEGLPLRDVTVVIDLCDGHHGCLAEPGLH